MKKQYQTSTGFIANLVQTIEEFKKLNSEPLSRFPTVEELLIELENGEADQFFEDKDTPFATWLVPKDGTLDIDGYKEYWQIEKTARNSFSIEKVSLEIILATIAKKYIVSFKHNFSKTEPERDGQIVYEER